MRRHLTDQRFTEWSRREPSDIDGSPDRVRELARANQTPTICLMSIVTKTGDKGETSLMYGHRVSKSDARVDAYGCVDELTAALGLARSIATDTFISDEILAAQKDLIVVMGELATAPSDRERFAKDGFHITTSAMVDRITAVINELERQIALSEGLGDSQGTPRFRGSRFCSHNMPSRRATHRCVQCQ